MGKYHRSAGGRSDVDSETEMPRYFFSCDGALDFDDADGTELPDLSSARIQAIENAGEILRDGAECFAECPRWRMTVTDEQGQVMFRLHFSVEQAQTGAA
jgi:hypothetical protein